MSDEKIPVGMKHLEEKYTEILLEDGNLIKIKPVIHEVLKHTALTDADGNPIYVVKSVNVVFVEKQKPHSRH